ncbi:ribonuclease D [Streptomyces sp. NPDC033754]|uniref:ribonuclease D n=1 Tax=unclassified Streptomyces TaxID=2593676 RepID=UPI0033DF9921
MEPRSYIHEGAFGRVEVSQFDLPADAYPVLLEAGRIAWDIETNGLDPHDAKIGTCQIYAEGVGIFIVTSLAEEVPPNLSRLLSDERVLKVFHHAPFDLSFMTAAWGISPKNTACTKIAAKLLSPGAPSEHFSLKYLMAHHFNLHLDKQVRFTDWLAKTLTPIQIEYAAGDVIRLLDLYDALTEKIDSRNLKDLYSECVRFLPTHVKLRLLGCPDPFKY